MNKLMLTLALLALASGSFAAENDTVVPAKINRADISGDIFNRETMIKTTHEDGHTTLDVTSLMSSDKKFASGMYQSGKTRSEITEPYGVDEFMYFIEGSITLTNQDGTKQVVRAGEAVTVPKEWKGIFETDGYKKFWVIYSADESGL